MAYDGNGNFSPPAPQYPAIPDTPIAAEDFNTIISEIAEALSLAILRDGQAAWTGDQDMGGKKIKNGAIDGAVTGVTQPVGTNTDQLATMKALQQQAFASNLPAQAGNAGKLLKTDGSNPVWVDTVANLILTSYRKTLVAANSTAAYALDCSTGNAFNLTLTANTVLSFANTPPVGVHFTVELTVKQDSTGGRTITWPAAVTWLGGPTPTIQSAPNSVDTFDMFTLDGGVTWYARHTTPSGLLHIYGAETVSGVKTFSSGMVTASLNGGPLAGSRNRIINGDMRIDQRNNGAAFVSLGSQYTLDRWAYGTTQSGKVNIQRNGGGISAPTSQGFTHFLFAQTAAAYTPAATDTAGLYQQIEGYSIADLGWGSASAKTVTLSFLVYVSQAGIYSGALKNGAGTRSYPFTFTVSNANVWTAISVTIPGDTSGTWAVDNTTGIGLQFNLGCGANYLGPAGAWAGANYVGASGSVSMVSTLSAYIAITGVQLEPGTVATPFERLEYGEQLRRCHRYFERRTFAASSTAFSLQCQNTSSAFGVFSFQPKRAAGGTITITGSLVALTSTGSSAGGTFTPQSINTDSARIDVTSASGLAAGNATVAFVNSGTVTIDISTEL